MNESNYTSLELSKKLAENGCELESEYYYGIHSDGMNGENNIIHLIHAKNTSETPTENYYDEEYRAYDILNDICVKYAKEMFGEDEDPSSMFCDQCSAPLGGWQKHSLHMLELIQYGEKQKAEDYIWENCTFNPKHK